jgi:hypothetical protein
MKSEGRKGREGKEKEEKGGSKIVTRVQKQTA